MLKKTVAFFSFCCSLGVSAVCSFTQNSLTGGKSHYGWQFASKTRCRPPSMAYLKKRSLMLQMVVPSELCLRRYTILLIRSSTTSLTSSEKTATSRGRIISCLSTLRILSQSCPSLKYKTQDVRQRCETVTFREMVKQSLFRQQDQKVAEDSRRDEAGGTSPHVSVLMP